MSLNNCNSNIYALANGIPQGSPLSVILFVIAFNEVSEILSRYNKTEHILYADDVLIFTKLSDLNAVTNIFTEILEELSLWSETSGAKISYSKCNLFHICNKKNCSNLTLSYNNVIIAKVSTLRFLGVFFDSKYTFKDHCSILRKSLAQILNIIKYLSSKHCLVHQSTLLQVTRALILSELDYGFPIYRKCAISHIKLLPSSPTRNVLAEAGLPFITPPSRIQ